ncbi:hypothetical protein L1987_64800 [Smallanthus sonchifolius]|uniref:Uncharacterized protein n=1 Tax=Smallanthus sonchifolius TaxID=185202 RepID=A0ACB9BSQ3_9ASTR|nr:hypothetical protein L1987_64800 [Smallanthus sonchifolius]
MFLVRICITDQNIDLGLEFRGIDLLFVKRHNVCAFLDANDPKSAEFVPVMNFLANSNISFAISHNISVFETTIRQFWESAESVSITNVEHIRATVHGQEVLFSENTIRQVLHFDDNPEAPIEFPSFYVKECFIRLGHPDEFKSANAMVASVVLGLIKGMDYNFSGLVFRQLKDNLTGAVKEKFLVYPRFLQIIINHLHLELQQDGHVFFFDHMTAKTLSYMKSRSKRTNREIANIPLFGHVLGEEEEFIPDVDPDLQIEEELLSFDEEEVEVEQNQENQQEAEADAEVEVEMPHIQEEEQHVDEPVQDAIFVEEVHIPIEPVIGVEAGEQEDEEEVAMSSGTLDAGIYGSDYYKSDSDIQAEPHASSSKRQAETDSDYELEEPKANKIKTGFEDVSSSPDSSTDTPQPTPHPSPQQVHIPTPPTSPSHEPTTSVPRVKTLSLEVKMLVEHLSPAFVIDPEFAMTIHTGHAAKTKEAVEVQEFDLPSASKRREARKRGKGTKTEIETVILDEEDIPSDDELNSLLDEIDNFGYNELYPEILPTEERESEKKRYFTEEGDEIQALSDEEKTEEDVQVNIVKPVITEQTTTASEATQTPTQPSIDPEFPNPKKPWLRRIVPEESPQTYEWIVEHQELKRPPVGWKYDAERKLFIIRRYKGGVQHFKNMTDFQTLPFYDLRDLAKLSFQNPGNVMMASDFEHFLHNQVNCDFKGMKPRKTQKKISKTRFHPKTKKPYVFLRYKPAQTHKTITIPKTVPVQLQTFRKWYYNPIIGSVVIECEGKEDIVIFEPMELLKFQPEDLEVLFQNHIQAYGDEDEADAKAYQRVVSLHVKPYIPRTTEGPVA